MPHSQDPVDDLDERREEMDHADQFPFLRLPNELISKTLSFASMKDRMNARVCKRLHTIEAETKYYIEKLHICNHTGYMKCKEWDRDARSGIDRRSGTQYIFCDASFSPDFMRFLDRVSNNTSVGTLYSSISLRHLTTRQIESDIYNTIKKFDAKNVRLFGVSSDGVLPERFLTDISAKCNLLNLGDHVPNAAELHEVYKGMVDGSLKLRELVLIYSLPVVTSRNFFELIGIRRDDGEFFSNRDIEMYEHDIYGNYYYIFDGDLIIEWWRSRLFKMVRHETLESLEEAKNAVRNKEGMERVDVAPIEE